MGFWKSEIHPSGQNMRPELEKAIENGILPPIPTLDEINLNRIHVAIIDRIDTLEQKTRGISGDWCVRLCRIQRDYKFKFKRDKTGKLLFENVVLPLSDIKLLNQISPEIDRVIDLRKQPYQITRKCPFCHEWFTSEDPRKKYCKKGHRILFNRKIASEKKNRNY